MTVTDALPVYHHREHHSIWIDAPPDVALAAARETRPEDVPLVSMLFRLRGLRSGRDTPIWASMQAPRLPAPRSGDADADRTALDAGRQPSGR